MPNPYFYIELTLSKTQWSTKLEREISTFPIVAVNEFVRDLQKLHFLYPMSILQTQKGKQLIHEILSELNIW